MSTTSISPPATPKIGKARTSSAKTVRLSGRSLEYWHLLSLDAPTVAVAWSGSLARAAHVRLPAIGLLMLALATWILYVSDRLLDGMQASHANLLKERHHFHARHRRVFLAASVPAGILLVWLVVTRMNPASRFEYLLLAAAAAIYLLCVHLPSRRAQASAHFPKELAVAIIFAIACVIPAWSREPASHLQLLAAGGAFALLCWLNCIAIETWEADGIRPTLNPLTAAIGEHLRSGCIALATGAMILALRFATAQYTAFAALALAIATSSYLLLQLDRKRTYLTPLRLRAAADAVLLTPIVFLLITRSILHWR